MRLGFYGANMEVAGEILEVAVKIIERMSELIHGLSLRYEKETSLVCHLQLKQLPLLGISHFPER